MSGQVSRDSVAENQADERAEVARREGYNLLSQTVWRVGASCLLAFCCCAELKHQGKRAEAKVRAASPRTEVEMTARALADSVCPPRF